MNTEHKRIVAIVGRPNVGKSALFNRLLRRRVSIVHEMCGVTRDRVAAECAWEEQRFELLDTGGLGHIDSAATGDVIADGINRQVKTAIEDAAVIIFTTDITTDCAPLDEEVARLLHRSGRPVFIAANKADNTPLESQTAEYERLGFPVFPVSALHNRGLGELMEAVLAHLPEEENPTLEKPLKVAVIGRPNAGKSSYINRLLKSDRLIVSDIPGTTRDSIAVPFTIGHGPQARHYELMDTAGIHRPGRSHGAVEKFSMMRTEESIQNTDVVVLMLDAEEGPRLQDKKAAALAIENSKGVLVVVNKWDLAEDSEVTQRAYEKEFRHQIPFLDFAPMIFISCQTGLNIRRSVEMIDYVGEQISTQIGTGILNRVIQDAVEKAPPPVVGTRRLKIYYAVQVTAKPVRIKLFVNNPTRAPHTYKSYLVNQLRKAFGLEGATLDLIFANRPRPDIEEKRHVHKNQPHPPPRASV